MFNSTIPAPSELPSSRQLVRSTAIAAAVSVVLLVTVVLPSEYAIDPTGIGRVLRLTEMGQIKQQLQAEAVADAAADAAAARSKPANPPVAVKEAPAATTVVATATEQQAPTAEKWQDEIQLFLQPGEGTEVKMRMNEGDKVQFTWNVSSGTVNFDAHGDGAGRSKSYEKGRGVASSQGVLQAAFTGSHGWFFRNRDKEGVTITLRTRGQYVGLKRVP